MPDEPNSFTLGGQVYQYYEDDSSLEEGGAVRQITGEIYEVIGKDAHISVIGNNLPVPASLFEATAAVIDAEDHVHSGNTITREDLSYETIMTFFNRYTMAEAIVIHP